MLGTTQEIDVKKKYVRMEELILITDVFLQQYNKESYVEKNYIYFNCKY